MAAVAPVAEEPKVEETPLEASVEAPVVPVAPVVAETKVEEAPATKKRRTRKTKAQKEAEAAAAAAAEAEAAKATEAEAKAIAAKVEDEILAKQAAATETKTEEVPAPKKKRTRKTKAQKEAEAAAAAAAEAEAAKTKTAEEPAPDADAAVAAAEQPAEAPAETPAPKKRRGRKSKAQKEAEAAAAAAAEAEAAMAAEAAKAAEEAAKAEAEAAAAAEAQAAEAESSEGEKEERMSFFSRLKRSRDNFTQSMAALIRGRKIDDDLYDELETNLLAADLGGETTYKIIDRLRDESRLRELSDAAALKRNLKAILSEILKPCEQPLDVTGKAPFVILMVGVNGAGKTTTIGKMARKYQDQGLKVMLAAGDTFRAAAVEQLKEWGERANVPVIAQPTGSDSASVIFDAVNAAKSRNMDVLICDTAGRLQNKDNLMEELRKIVRVMKKIDPEVPHEVLLVLDGTTGQNAVSQVRAFNEAVNVTGLVLTKLDGSAKGGIIFSLADLFKIPLRYVGIGESAADLREFKTEPFVDALIDDKDIE